MKDPLKGLVIGDFVQSRNWFGDVWSEVLKVFRERGVVHAIVMATHRTGSHHEYAFTSDLRRKIHKSDAPWREGELRIAHTSTGSFGGREDPPLPDRFKSSLLEQLALAAE